MAIDIVLAPLYRIKGQEITNMPGLLASMPPKSAARGRDQDRLIAYLVLAGNSVFTTTEYMQVAENAAKVFYSTPGSMTNALRTANDSVNKALLERNMESSNRGQYALGWLILAALRDSQFTMLLSGPMHVYHLGLGESRHIFEPQISGKGLGMGQTPAIHYAQVTLQPSDRVLFCGKVPGAWESTLNDPAPSSMDALRRRLVTLTSEDLNSVLIQSREGAGMVTLLNGATEFKEEKPAAPPPSLTESLPSREEPLPAPRADSPAATVHMVQPSAYSIPPQQPETSEALQQDDPLAHLPRSITGAGTRDFPASIPRARPQTQPIIAQPADEPIAQPQKPQAVIEEKRPLETEAASAQPEAPRVPSENARRAAKTLATSIQTSRRLSASFGERMRNFLPRLLPSSESLDVAPSGSPDISMFFMAILIPLIVVTIASVVYLRYGRSLQYETYVQQAQEMRNQAAGLTNPVEQRKAWENVLLNVDIAESHRQTNETIALRQEAEANLDALLGITRLQFNPAFSSNLGIDISRMAASESDLFLLNAATGEVLRATLTSGRGFQLDTAFNCRPGVYGNYTVGPLVDILAMPTLNSINATLLGIDASGNLLYCSPGQVAQAIPLPTPDTNWGRVTAFVLESGNLYVLDAPARAVWVYNGRDGAFIDRPYFFFGQQTPSQDVIDLVVTGDDLYMLHADGHLSWCSYSRIESVPTRCQDPTLLVNPFAAYQDMDLFSTAHFTQMLFTSPPDQSLLLLDADAQGVMRFTPRSLDLQNQLRPTTGTVNPIPRGPVDAVTVSPNHYLYVALDGQVFFATMP